MKLINRDKFFTDKDYPCSGERYYNEKRGEHPERVYECDYNRCRMTVLESIWLYPEYSLMFGKYRKPNILWFILLMWCPWVKNLYDALKEYGLLRLTVIEFLTLLVIWALTICGLGFVVTIISHYRWIQNTRRLNDFTNNKEYNKYGRIKLL